ncbi:MAG: hypothetical protein R2781_11500 [Flavobacteriaceae bacterium]
MEGNENILWPKNMCRFILQRPLAQLLELKHIPLTQESLPNIFGLPEMPFFAIFTKQAHLEWVWEDIFQAVFSILKEKKNEIKLGRLSGIVAISSPSTFKKTGCLWETNCIEDWEEKVNAIVAEPRQKT